MTAAPARTPLFDWHVAHGGRMVEFGGWSMPVQYTSIVAEHVATRTGVGLFDISHMGRLRFSGSQAPGFLDRLATRKASKLEPGQVAYALVTNETGGIKDDVLVYHLTDAAGTPYHLMVVNAGNRQKVVEWIGRQKPASGDLQFADITFDWAMIAVQGPNALQLLQPLAAADLAGMKYYTACESQVAGLPCVISRTGYTGEDGFEIMLGSPSVTRIWQQLVDQGQSASIGLAPAGLGCRDTLRLEAGMPLYGHELSEEINPFQAGLSFAVDLEQAAFPGAELLAAAKSNKTRPRRVGLQLDGKRPAREGCPILSADDAQRQIGYVTSGTFSPTFQRPVAMGYIEPAQSIVGNPVLIDIRGRQEPAKIVKLPFYRRKSEAG